jgi:hypothetical protein
MARPRAFYIPVSLFRPRRQLVLILVPAEKAHHRREPVKGTDYAGDAY